MSGHTPGPWYHGGKHPDCEARYVKSNAPGYAVEIAILFHSDGAEQEANCRLIAAAPELLEAIKLAEAALADIGDADREPGDDLAWCERRAAEPLLIIRAAIAKAEGRE